MSHHETFVRNAWAELLARDDIVGGNIYFIERKCTYVGRTERVVDKGDYVVFYLQWCGYKTKHHGWTRRHRWRVTCEKLRLSLKPDCASFGQTRLFFKGKDPVERDQIRSPMTRAELREAKRRRKEGEDPGPLFAAR